MLHHFVHVLLVFISSRFFSFAWCGAASLGLRSCLLLIAKEALQIVAQLAVDLFLIFLSLLGPNEREEAVHLPAGLFDDALIVPLVFLEHFVLNLEVFIHHLLVEVLALGLNAIKLSQLLEEVLLLLAL